MSANEAITLVIDGGRTRSRIANAPGVIAPSLASVVNAESWDSETGDDGFRNRSWRESRMTANDKSLASRASLSSTAEVTTEVQTRASETANDDFGSTHCRPTTHQQVVVPPAGAEATHPAVRRRIIAALC